MYPTWLQHWDHRVQYIHVHSGDHFSNNWWSLCVYSYVMYINCQYVSVVTPVSLLPTGALPKLFPTASLPSTLSSLPHRSFPPELSPHYFWWLLPKLFPTVSLPSTLSSLPYCSFLSPSISHGFPSVHPAHRSSPQTISHGFPSVHPVVTPVSLLPTGALPKLFPTASLPSPCRHSRIAPLTGALPKRFPTVSLPSTLSSLPYRSFPPELSPCYFPWFPLRPPNRCFHPFPPNGALPKLFPTVSPPSTQSSNPYRSLAANVTKREPKHRRCFWEKTIFGNWEFATTGKSLYELWVSIPQRIAIVQNAWDKLTLNLHPCRRLPRDGGIQLVAGGLAPRWRYL